MEEPIREASQQVSEEFKTLVNAHDLNSLRHLQHLMYVIIVSFFFFFGNDDYLIFHCLLG